jgi:hypothetical protein
LPLAVANHSGTTDTAYIAIGAIGSASFAVLLAYVVSLGARKPWARPIEVSPPDAIVNDRLQTAPARLGSR